MSSRRTLILIGALVAGAVAALLIFQYVGGIEEKAQGEAQMVNVVIAQGEVPKGGVANDLIASGTIAIGERRAREIPTNAVSRPEEIKGQIAQLNLAPGTIITSSMFESDAALTDSASRALRPGMVAVTISTDQIKGVAGLITQGDFVNMTVVGQCYNDASGKLSLDGGSATGGSGGDTAGATGGEAAPARELFGCSASLYQKVEILAIGRSLGAGVSAPVATPGEAAPPTTEAPTSDLITFEVPPEAAQNIQLAGNGIYMTLVREDYQPHPIPVSPFLPIPGVDGGTPYPTDPAAETAGE